MSLNADTLSAELERLFDLVELQEIGTSVLGLEPDAVGGAGAKASFARALAERCVERDAVPALLDAVEASRQADAKLLRQKNGVAERPAESALSAAGFTLVAEIGAGPSATVHRAYHDGDLVRLRVVVAPPRDAQRYLLATRRAAGVMHPGLPEGVRAEAIPGGFVVAQPFLEGETLGQILKKTGPRHVNELLPLLHAVAEPLSLLHERRIVHGALHLENVLVLDQSPTAPKVMLLDTGAHLLRPTLPQAPGEHARSWLSATAPETLRGEGLTPASDVYAFGILVYQLLSGKDPFVGESAVDVVVSHLTQTPDPISFAAGRGVGPDIDAFVQALLVREPERRPRDGTELIESLRRVWRASTRPPSWVSDERLEGRFAVLAENPDDEEEAAALEASVDLGADAKRIAQGFCDAVTVAEERGMPGTAKAVPRLLLRAARLFETASDFEQAEGLYERLLELDANDASSFAALVRLRKRLKKHEALVELFLNRSEAAESATERAQCFAEIGELYAGELADKDQAVVAFAQAFSEDPVSEERARAVERVAGNNTKAWSDVLDRCADAANGGDIAEEARTALLLKAADWYTLKLSRPDMARELLNSVLSKDPGNDAALAGLADLYRRSQQWLELGQVLARRADIAAPPVARDLRAEAADVLANRLANAGAAEEMFTAVLAEDPGHGKAAEGMAELLKARGEGKKGLELLESRALVLRGEERFRQLLKIAEAWEIEQDQLDEAERLYRRVLVEDGKQLDALRGLDRVLNRAQRYKELVEVLKQEIELSVTPRQKIGFYERLAGIYDEEYLDPAQAAGALEAVLAVDPARSSAAVELARHYRRLERWNDLRDLYQSQVEKSTEKDWKIEAGLALARLFDERLGLLARAIEELERVLELAPDHPGALGALAGLRARIGDSENALAAIEKLADTAATPQDRAEHFVRAAEILRERGDHNGAIRELKRALDAVPEHATANRKLINAYIDVGHHAAAVELLEERLGATKGDRARAGVAGQMAIVCHRHLRDDERALAMAQMALHLDPTNLDALRVQARVAYADDRFADAAKRLESVVTQADALPEDELAETVFSYVDSLAKSGAEEKALTTADQFIDALAKSATFLLPVCEISAQHGSPQRTADLVRRLLEEHAEMLEPAEEALARRLLGESLRKQGHAQQALAELDRAVRLDGESQKALHALADVYADLGDVQRSVDIRRREIELVEGNDRVPLLVELGEVVADKLGDNDYAGRCFLMALDIAPNDRKILTRLMQLFSVEKDWSRLLDVVTRLSDLVEDGKQKAKYLHTAAMVAAREIGDPHQALGLLDAALAADPSHEGAMQEALAIRRRLADWDGIKDILKARAQRLAQEGKNKELLSTLDELGETYERIGSVEQAARVYESALDVEPDGVRWLERLARAYSTDEGFSEQAIDALTLWIEVDPYRPEPYQIMRKVHTQSRHADGAWLSCQALHVLGQAQPDESRFYGRFRNEEQANARRRLSAEEWMELVMPSDGEPLITSLFSLIQPYVLSVRGRPEAAYGLGVDDELDMERYPHGLVYALYHGSQVIPADELRIFQRQTDPVRLMPLATHEPSIMLGAGAFAEGMGPLEAAFLAGHELAHSLPGLRLRTVLPNLTALKAWLLGAIRLVKPKFPVAGELEASVLEAASVLQEAATGEYRDHLVHTVSKLLSDSAALDLKRWVRSVDQTGDRAGLILAGDLDVSANLIRSEPARPGAAEAVTRARDLLTYSVSSAHLTVRERLGISVDA